MEIKEHGNHLIVRLYHEDSREEFVEKMRDVLRENPNRKILLYLDESPEHVVDSMESIVAKMEGRLTPTDLPDITTLMMRIRGDSHIGHFKTHRDQGAHSRDPSKGISGMPRKHRHR